MTTQLIPKGWQSISEILSTQKKYDLTTKRHLLTFSLICFPDISCPYVNIYVYMYLYTQGCRDLFKNFTSVQLNVFMHLSHGV